MKEERKCNLEGVPTEYPGVSFGLVGRIESIEKKLEYISFLGPEYERRM